MGRPVWSVALQYRLTGRPLPLPAWCAVEGRVEPSDQKWWVIQKAM
jgi:hypothetical protein